MLDKHIQQIRQSAREIVRESGLLLDETPYKLSLSFRHVLIELDLQGSLNQVNLKNLLNLDKSTVSRIIQKLVKYKLIKLSQNKADKRVNLIHLTLEGKKIANQINKAGNARVEAGLKNLNRNELQTVIKGLKLYAVALKKAVQPKM